MFFRTGCIPSLLCVLLNGSLSELPCTVVYRLTLTKIHEAGSNELLHQGVMGNYSLVGLFCRNCMCYGYAGDCLCTKSCATATERLSHHATDLTQSEHALFSMRVYLNLVSESVPYEIRKLREENVRLQEDLAQCQVCLICIIVCHKLELTFITIPIPFCLFSIRSLAIGIFFKLDD